MSEHVEPPQRFTPPALYLLLDLPYGAAVGYLSVAVPFWLAARGISLAQIGALSATAFLPHAIKVLWVPLLDIGSHRKLWYLAMAAGTGTLLAVLSVLPGLVDHLWLYTALLTAAQVTATTGHAALNALVAVTTHEKDKAKAAGYYMASNVGGTGLLGALALWLASHTSPNVAGGVLAGVVVASGAAALPIFEPRRVDAAIAAADGALRALALRAASILSDLWRTARSRAGFTGLLISLAPVGCGALTNLFSGIAPEYGASQEVVEVVNGIGGGLAGALGSLLGGFLAERMNRRLAYALAGGVTALTALAMLAAPTSPTTYVWGVLAYNFANGIAFATWAGMVLEVVGAGAAVATNYALFVATSNLAISYVTALDGWASEFRGLGGGWAHAAGARGALGFDALLTFLGIALLLAMVAVTSRMRPAAVPASS
ncbi:MAG TPA: MFS transporter [Anaeromyxobacteraceae bacterium]|nr:MFS transporter [Anaeromyxobacteraceae bacterium]